MKSTFFNNNLTSTITAIASIALNIILIIQLFHDGNKNQSAIKYNLKSFDFHYLPETNDPKLAFLGDSIIRQMNIASLFGRTDIINRGVSGDRSIDMPERLRYILSKKPKYLIIEGGINDINSGIHVSEILNSKLVIVNFCKENKITPILIGTIPVTKKPVAQLFKSSSHINHEVKKLNEEIGYLAQRENVKFLRPDENLARDGYLADELSTDGVHLNEQGYVAFAKYINRYLMNEKM